mgnify:CR=1 FL=1
MKKYFYSDGKDKFGPFSFEELKNENITKDTLIWFEGLEDWKQAKEIGEFEEILKLIPPPIIPEKLNLEATDTKFEAQNADAEVTNNNTNAQNLKRRGMFSNPFSFKGRIRRLEYGISFIIAVFLISFINVLIEESYELAWLFLAYIPLYWFFFAQGAKRCHDMGNSGWYQIIPFYALWMIFAKGEEGISNKYGINPKI